MTVPLLVADVRQASLFTIVPEPIPKDFTLTWYNGNIYSLSNSSIQLISLPTSPSTDTATIYHILVSGDYEIRLFGDPVDIEKQETPVQRLEVRLDVLQTKSPPPIIPQNQLDVVPNFVDGWPLSSEGALGIGILAMDSWWTVVAVESLTPGVGFELIESHFRLAPLQTRILPLRLRQTTPYYGDSVMLSIIAQQGRHRATLPELTTTRVSITIPIVQKRRWRLGGETYKATYHLGTTPFYYMVKAPKHCNRTAPALLAIHGAGVETDNPFWTSSIRTQNSSWVIFPTGRTPWGFDWHGPSSLDVWGAFHAFREILEQNELWKACSIDYHQVLLIGHSNGGQGVWYHASRFPDKVIAVAAVPAAAYIKSQQYVPLSLSHGAHFADVKLRMILEAALQPDDNDIFLSNLAVVPILATHGGNDRNVPTWHSRELISVLRSWNTYADTRYYEVDNEPHWWDTVLSSDTVQDFIEETLTSHRSRHRTSAFTLTTLIPEETGSMHGFRILDIATPGLLARLRVRRSGDDVAVSTVNTRQFSLDTECWGAISSITVDAQVVSFRPSANNLWFAKDNGTWQSLAEPQLVRPSGPMNRILATTRPLTIVIPRSDIYVSYALRIAHSLLSYLRVDTNIAFDDEALRLHDQASMDCSNLVILGGVDNIFGRAVLAKSPSEVRFTEEGWQLRSYLFNEPGLGILFLHSHPVCSSSLVMFVFGMDAEGFERALRLVPLRTGVGVPEWIITSNSADATGAGGILGAG
ncbi:hypothetical protein FRC17_005560, partial [Serendipita sp. 399]